MPMMGNAYYVISLSLQLEGLFVRVEWFQTQQHNNSQNYGSIVKSLNAVYVIIFT